MTPNAAEASARAAYQAALEEIHDAAPPVGRINYRLPVLGVKPWTEEERAAVARYATAWARLLRARSHLDDVLHPQ